MKSVQLPAICLPIILSFGSNSPVLLNTNVASNQVNRNPIEQQVIIYNDCQKCSSEEGGEICCPA